MVKKIDVRTEEKIISSFIHHAIVKQKTIERIPDLRTLAQLVVNL